jgi:hypothetical protein
LDLPFSPKRSGKNGIRRKEGSTFVFKNKVILCANSFKKFFAFHPRRISEETNACKLVPMSANVNPQFWVRS